MIRNALWLQYYDPAFVAMIDGWRLKRLVRRRSINLYCTRKHYTPLWFYSRSLQAATLYRIDKVAQFVYDPQCAVPPVEMGGMGAEAKQSTPGLVCSG